MSMQITHAERQRAAELLSSIHRLQERKSTLLAVQDGITERADGV
jgi:hypothetical protein